MDHLKNKPWRPNLYIIAGPNGAGKTTYEESEEVASSPWRFGPRKLFGRLWLTQLPNIAVMVFRLPSGAMEEWFVSLRIRLRFGSLRLKTRSFGRSENRPKERRFHSGLLSSLRSGKKVALFDRNKWPL